MSLLKTAWNWLSPPPPETDESFPPPGPPLDARAEDDPVISALERRLDELLLREIPRHRRFAGQDVLELHCIEIAAAPEGRVLLERFFKEFSPAARLAWARRHLGGNTMVTLDGFAGIFGSAELPDTAAMDKHEQMLSQGAPPAFAIHLWGNWKHAEGQPPPGPAAAGRPVLLRVLDAQGRRPEIRLDAYPLGIGRSAACAVAVAGAFVSGSHCSLHAEGGRIWLEDHSRNGTWLDGEKLPPRQRVELGAGRHRLKLGRAEGEAKDCPEIELELQALAATPVAAATPIAGATPVAAPAGPLLAVLSIEDATGRPLRDVLGLPYTVGRAEDRDYPVPAAHAGVSGRHLSIVEITADGARVANEACEKNGTALNGELQPAEFFWPFGAEIVLAPKWRRDPPVRIVLKRP